jgi:hypothetical protein
MVTSLFTARLNDLRGNRNKIDVIPVLELNFDVRGERTYRRTTSY